MEAPPTGNYSAGQGTKESHGTFARPDSCGGATIGTQIQSVLAPPHASAYARLGIFAAAVDDIERTRIALGNRSGAFVREGADPDHPDVVAMKSLSEAMETTERIAIKRMEKCLLKELPVGAWVKNTNGLGLKTVARFIASVGDPRVRPVRGEEDENGKRPIIGYADRTVSQLWSYCGLDVREGKAPKLARGTKANWNGIARKRAFCMAEPCIKNMNSEYRSVYDAARLKYADAEISDLHKHRRAMRAVMKAIVKDLWVNAGAKDLTDNHSGLAPSSPTPNQGGAGQERRDTQDNPARAAKEVANE